MFTVLLSDRALKDFADSHNAASACLKSLTKALDSSETDCISQHSQITKLKYFKPNAWRYRHFYNSVWYRVVFTIASRNELIVHRILPRSEIDYRRDLPEYLYAHCRGTEVTWVDLDDAQSLDSSPDSEVEFDDSYQDYSRHYRLPQTLIEGASSPEAIADYILSGSYLYRPKLTSEQEAHLSCNLRNSSSRIMQIQGSAGTGKTTLAFHLADVAITQGFYPLIVVPNNDLQQVGKALIDGLDKNYQIALTLKSQASIDLSIVTAEHFFQELSEDSEAAISTSEANQRIRQAFADYKIDLSESLNQTNFYAIQQSILETEDQYKLSGKDSLIIGQEQAVEYLHKLRDDLQKKKGHKKQEKYKKLKEHKNFTDLYEGRDLASQSKRAIQRIESGSQDLVELLQSDLPVMLVIDEVQDYYWFQLKAIYSFLQKYTSSSLLVLLGDENQRVTLSGFTWAALANSFKSAYNVELPKRLELTRNFRNTKAIAGVAKFILEDAFPIGEVVCGGKHPQKLPAPETCFEEGFPPRLIEVDDRWLSEFIDRLKSIETSTNSRFVLLVHEVSESYRQLKQEFSLDSEQQVVVLNVRQAKGQEFDAVILLSPFLLRREKLALDDLFEWYTSITRARRYEAILVTPQEMQWLKAKTSFEKLEAVFSISSNPDLEEFVGEVRLEGRSFLSVRQLQKLYMAQVAESVIEWITTGQYPGQLATNCQRYNLEWWNICEEIEAEAWELLGDREIDYSRLRAIDQTFQTSKSVQDLTILYFATKELLVQAQINVKPMAAGIVLRLEQWFANAPQQATQCLQEVKHDELRVMLLRAAGHSWQAAALLKKDAATDSIEEIAIDLERRGLPYEAARLRVQYLDWDCPSDYPLKEALNRTEPLAEALCRHFVEIMETLK